MPRVKSTQASVIARYLGAPLHGKDVVVDRVDSLDAVAKGSLSFMQRYHEGVAAELNRIPGHFVLAEPAAAGRLRCSHIIVPDPRLAFARAAQQFFEEKHEARIASSACVHSGALLGQNVQIGNCSVIDEDVRIGDECVIGDHVVLRSGSRIGKRCFILSQAVIGEAGFGFDFADRVPVRIPHFGGVVIGDDVQIGCGTTVACGTMNDTIIEDHVKIDNLVHVAHNCVVGSGSIITSGVVLCGRTRVGRRVWIGPNAVVKEGGVSVGDDALVGVGAVVLKSVKPRCVVFGNPALTVRERRKDEEF